MAYSRLYTAIGFEDRPSRKSPLSAVNLNKIDQGIAGLDDRIVEMSVREDDLEERLEAVETRDICSRTVKSANAATHSNYPTDNAKVPDMSFMSYWNGAYSSNGGSNLAYCKHGAFGTMATKNAANYTPVTNLITTVAGKPLDAIMGKELNDKILAVDGKIIFSETEPTTVEAGKIVMVYE